ncbi:MAG TPA: membrane protein insertase YidC, partial [Acidobacteriaceae bacterium]
MPEFRNPNQGGSGGGSQDNRSFLIMMIVMISVIFGLQYWHSQHNPPVAPPTSTEAPAAPPATSTSTPPAATSAASAASATRSVGNTPAVVAAEEATTVVENELYRITFSNRGGQVSSWILKKYKDSEGHPLDLVHSGASALYGYPLSLYTYDDGLNTQLATALYVPSSTGTLEAPATLTFKYAAGNLSVTKTFTFGANYLVHADTVVLKDGAPIRALLSWPAGLGDMDTTATYGGTQVDTSSN